MAKSYMELITSDETLYKCDKCSATFKPREITLKECSGNVEIITPVSRIMVISAEGFIQGVGSPQKGDRTVHCPKCNEWHPNGFDKAE